MARDWSTQHAIHRTLRVHTSPQRGEDVRALQVALNRRAASRQLPRVAVDGYYGEETARAVEAVGYALGVIAAALSKGGTPWVQRAIRHPWLRTPAELNRARRRKKPSLWHPAAQRVQHSDAGPFTGGGHALVWHTTQTTGLPDYGGSSPHFTIDPASGRLWQHIPINRAARALKAGGPNFWNKIQVEIIGYAEHSQDWSDSEYAHLARLARWIERNAGVPRRCGVTFSRTPHRLSMDEFRAYAGHCGHQHAPAETGETHWDPGAMRIEKIL